MNRQTYYKAIAVLIAFTLLLPITSFGTPPNRVQALNFPQSQAWTAPQDFDPSRLRVKETQPVLVGTVASQAGAFQSYFVLLEDPAVPAYSGGITGLRPTSPFATGESQLDLQAPEVAAYTQYLRSRQVEALSQIETALGRQVIARHLYRYALNGFALKLAPDEATRITALPGIGRVELDQAHRPNTDVSPQWLGATSIWDGSATGDAGTLGEGVIVGILDTGINMDHPSFAALGGDGYLHTNPLGAGNYLGWCNSSHPDYDPAYVCNDKLIGAWDYADATWGENDGPLDENGHGSHTASTAAGNYIAEATLYAPTTSYADSISGMAPHANLIAYDVCGSSCFDTDVVAAVEQAILDGVDVLNESIGIGGDTFSGPKQTAYLNAVSAGIFYARSAGNEGPGSGSIGPEPPWTLTTAGLTHNRKISNQLVDMVGGDSPPADMEGVGFTAGYGPAPIVYAADYLDTLKPGATAEDARLCAMGNPDDMVFETPWEAGTFDGEIVVCDRGLYPRVEKGWNVQEVGAGGFVLADNGGGIVSDAHYLPGLHISLENGDALKAWLDPGVVQTATITGYELDYSAANGDIMAGFSSRGPGDHNYIKPDAGAPGVAIWAAYVDNPGGPDEGNEFSFLGGTSMASPHIAGLAALLKAARPDWSAAEIKSALMTTATHANTVKEDGTTPTDPFDTGSGRVRVDRAVQAGLLFDISPAEFDAANGTNAGELNLPSFANEACFNSCSWTRTASNALDHPETWYAVLDNPAGIQLAVDPPSFTLSSGMTRTFTVTATLNDPPLNSWSFGGVTFSPEGASAPDSYLPLALYASSGSDLAVLHKEVDLTEVERFGTLNYTLTVGNPSTSAVTYAMTDTIPQYAQYQPGSAWGGLAYQADLDALTWQGGMDASVIEIQPVFGSQFQSLPSFGIEPFDLPANADEGGWYMSGFDFWFLGQHYSEVIWSVNGTLEAGVTSSLAAGGSNTTLPNPVLPNNLLAPWWSDIDFNDGGAWYIGTLTDNVNDYDVLEWNNAPRKGTSGSQTATFQIWIKRGSDEIWFEYNAISRTWTDATVGVEDASGTSGDQVYYNGSGDKPSRTNDLFVFYSQPTPLTMGFSVQVDGPSGALVHNEAVLTDQLDSLYEARVTTRILPYVEIFVPLILRNLSIP